MKKLNHILGAKAESEAVRYLSGKGYTILERNFANKYGEIDIIAKEKESLVFVEVKAKTGIEFGHPEEMVSKGKLAKVRQMGLIYLKDKPLPCRIDVIAIVMDRDGGIVRLNHYVNVY